MNRAIRLRCGTTAALWLLGAGAVAAPLTVERIVSAPSITGTAATAPAWSPDGRRLAFLWNDAGAANRQVWITDGAAPRLAWPRPAAGAAAASNVQELAWTPGGRTLLLLADGDLWRLDTESGDATRLTQDGGHKSALTSAPDGRRAAYLKDGDLWLADLDRQHSEQLTKVGIPGISALPVGRYSRPEVEIGPGTWGGPGYAWSPDGRYIALHRVDRRELRRVPFPDYLARETNPNEVRRPYPGDANESRRVGLLRLRDRRLDWLDLPEPAAVQVLGFSWSPRGALLVDRASDSNVDRWLHVVDPGSVAPRQVWHGRRESRVYTQFTSAWHPDGRQVLFSSDLEDRYGLYRLDPGSGRYSRLTPATHDLLGDITVQGGAVVYQANDPNPYELQAFRVDADGGTPTRLTFMPGQNMAYPSPDGRRVAFLHSADDSPTELYLASAGEPGAARITTSPPAEFYERRWARARYLSFPSRVDDYTLHARILEPPDLEAGRRYPVVFGPVYSNSVRNRWAGMYGTVQQLLVDRGYIVVQVDVRGSTGYGRDFREAFLADFAGGDLEDLASAVAWLRTLPQVDPDRMGIWGSSYGGTLTVYSLLKKPGLFRAGVAAASAVDPAFFGPDDVAIVRTPGTHPAIFERLASHHAANLEDHLLIIHGMQDQVVPFKTTVVLAEALMRAGKDFDFAFAPAASHRWMAEPHYARYLLGKLLAHFDRYLEP